MEIKNNNNKQIQLNYFDFNDNSSCISIGTNNGFQIITCEPFNKHYFRNLGIRINIVEIYKSSNIIIYTESEKNSRLSNKLIIYDYYKQQKIKEMIFSGKIKLIKTIKDYLFVQTEIQLYIFKFENLFLLDTKEIDIYNYNNILIDFSVNLYIKVAYAEENRDKISIWNSNIKKKLNINGDIDKISLLKFNLKGNILACAGDNRIMLYNSTNGELILKKKNSDLENGKISCIDFSSDDKFLYISTINKTYGFIYLFDIENDKDSFFNISFFDDDYLGKFKVDNNYFSFRYFNGNIIIITSNGLYMKIKFDKNKECFQEIIRKKIFN